MLRRETEGDAEARAAALAGLAAYQRAPRPAAPDLPPITHRVDRAGLRDYGGVGTPILFVPSLINPPHILDLGAETGLLRWLADQGRRVLLLDWGCPAPGEPRAIAGHVTELLLPLIAALEAPPVLAGYCLGGTMAAAAACLTAVKGLAVIAAPWRFHGFAPPARARIAALWAEAEPACARLGLVPMEVLQAGFWRLDPARTIAKYARFARLDPASAAAAAFVALEDWANGGAPLAYAAGAELFDFFAHDAPGRGAWMVGGRAIDPHALDCPRIDFVSTSDRIVPAASAAGFPDRHASRAGHVGMVVGSARRDALWHPLRDWLARIA
ncbi:MAG: poly-beta-hydroxybutyrate polymerase [Proteobacteria bacterium SG_bin5]|nr:alpha/beta hydrolase [Sphingomonas sp.]OQW39965.1 MAG: poly-beta-hydroxybutyrate polymerase [Proteobacteria bacterium SG_bin5]